MNEIDSLKAIIDSIKTIQNSTSVDVANLLSNSNAGINFYDFIAIITMTIGIATFIIYMRHNKLSTKPLLRIDSYWDRSKLIFYIELSNQGLGPAIITYFEFLWDNKNYETHYNFFDSLMDSPEYSEFAHSIMDFSLNYIPQSSTIQKNSSIKLLEINFSSFHENFMSVDKREAIKIIDKFLRNHFSYKIEYSNIYNKKMGELKFPDLDKDEIINSNDAQMEHSKK